LVTVALVAAVVAVGLFSTGFLFAGCCVEEAVVVVGGRVGAEAECRAGEAEAAEAAIAAEVTVLLVVALAFTAAARVFSAP
jgi:hypothetical protein